MNITLRAATEEASSCSQNGETVTRPVDVSLAATGARGRSVVVRNGCEQRDAYNQMMQANIAQMAVCQGQQVNANLGLQQGGLGAMLFNWRP